MKATDVKACVARQLDRLQQMQKPRQRAELAELRRGIGHQPGDLPALWGSFLEAMPESFWGGEGPSHAEWAVYLALTMYALHQQGKDTSSMNEQGMTLGKAVRRLAEKNAASSGQNWDESSVLRRFNALATAASMPEAAHHLRGIVQLLRREDIPLDYPQLAEDLYKFQFIDYAANVRLQWGRDLYYNANAAEQNDTEAKEK